MSIFFQIKGIECKRNLKWLSMQMLKKNFRILFKPIKPPGHPWVFTKNLSPFSPAVWPAIRNKYMNVLFYDIDIYYIYNLFNKTTHLYLYVVYRRPNGWTEWAEIYCGHSGVCYRLKNSKFFIQIFKKKIFHGQRWALKHSIS